MNILRSTRELKGIVFATICVLLMAGCGGEKGEGPVNPPTPGQGGGNKPKPSTGETAVLPAKDFRAAWVATVQNLDWPQGKYDEASQKALFTQYVNKLQELHMNAMFFQVRPIADTFWESQYEPWSRYITGTEGKKPSYDVLRWMIDECHKRGIAFHAWINPYRIARNGSATVSPMIPAKLVKRYNNCIIYNPALPETRERIANIVKELLQKYDVDGIHFDDYFYPSLSGSEPMNDDAEFRKYGSDFTDIKVFRRAMVDSMVTKVQRTIREVRPSAVFSISPQGNLDNDVNQMYADVPLWARKGWVDVIIPQLYWSTKEWFGPRLTQFATQCAGKNKFMVGYGIYRFDKGQNSQWDNDVNYQSNADLQRQFTMAYNNKKVAGSSLYRAQNLLDNPEKINEVIAKQFAKPALLPYLSMLPEAKPAAPQGLKAEGNKLTWDAVAGCYYAVYQHNGDKKVATLVAIVQTNACDLTAKGKFFVTAVKKADNAESEISAIVEKK